MRFPRHSPNPSQLASPSLRTSPQPSPYIAETKPSRTILPSRNWVRSATCLPPLPFRRPDLPLIQPEVVRHLVPDRILHQLGEVLRTARHALVRALENRDAVRHREWLEHAPPGQRGPFRSEEHT